MTSLRRAIFAFVSARLRRGRMVLAVYLVVFGLPLVVETWHNQCANSLQRWPDSQEYSYQARFSPLSAQFQFGLRPPGTPLMFRLVGNDDRAIGRLQTAIYIVAWCALALALFHITRTHLARSLALVGLWAVALSTNFQVWNSAILSESLSISLFVIFIAVAIELIQRPNWLYALLTGVIGASAAIVRLTNAYLGLALGLLWLAVVFFRTVRRRSWRFRRVLFAVPAVMLCLAFFWSSYTSNHVPADPNSPFERQRYAGLTMRWAYPLLNVIGRRILVDEQARRHFVRAGMPITPQLLAYAGHFAFWDGYRVYRDPALAPFRRWFEQYGRRTYATLLLLHPAYASAGLLRDAKSWLSIGEAANQKELGFGPRPLKTNTISGLHLRYQHALIILAPLALVALLLLLLAPRRGLRQPGVLCALVTLVLTVPHVFLVYHGDDMGVGRHALLVRLQLYLGLLMLTVAIADSYSRRFYRSRHAPAESG